MPRLTAVTMLILLLGAIAEGRTAESGRVAQTYWKEEAVRSYQHAVEMIEAGRFEDSLELLERVIALEPEWGEPHLKLGEALYGLYNRTEEPAVAKRLLSAMERARASTPSTAGESLFLSGQLYSIQEDYETALQFYERAFETGFRVKPLYVARWLCMLKLPGYEERIPLIRREIDGLLTTAIGSGSRSALGRLDALQVAQVGYSFYFLNDPAAEDKVIESILEEFPDSDPAWKILTRRLRAEKDPAGRFERAQEILTLFPSREKPAWFYLILLDHHSREAGHASQTLGELVEALLSASYRSGTERVFLLASASLILSDRTAEQESALRLAREAVTFADSLTVDSISPRLTVESNPERWAAVQQSIGTYRAQARGARGFALLRMGKPEQAAPDLESSLASVIQEVDASGFTEDKTILGHLQVDPFPPPVLWLADLYEARGRKVRAADFLLASWLGSEASARKSIRERLAALYASLGREAGDVEGDLARAERYHQAYQAAADSNSLQVLSEGKLVEVNRKSPEVEFISLEGNTFSLSDLQGKVVVLNFWATWCAPCIAEMPHYREIVDEYRSNQEIVLLAANMDSLRAPVRPFVERNGYDFPIVFGEDLESAFEVWEIPHMLFIDRKGMIRFALLGFEDPVDYSEVVRQSILGLLK